MTDFELFDGMYLGVAYDAMRLMGYNPQQFYINIKPKVYNNKLLIGQAFTTYGEVVSNNINYNELDKIRLDMYGDMNKIHKSYSVDGLKPFVVLQSNDCKVAHSGDITSLIYQKLNSVGFVTDGIVRDIDKIKEINFPTFCKEVNPIDAIDYWALTKYNIKLTVECVDIEPGDIIIGSMDGIIRVKLSDWGVFKEKSKEVLLKENVVRHLINTCEVNNQNLGTFFNNLLKQNGRW